MVILEPIEPYWRYREEEAEFRLVDARCACGGDVFVLTRQLGQMPAVCAALRRPLP